MKKIFFGFVLLIFSSINLYSAEIEVYCFSPSSSMVFKHSDYRQNPTTPLCETQIPKSVYQKIDKESDLWFEKGSIKDPDAGFFSNAPLRNNPKFIRERAQAINDIYSQSKDEIASYNKSLEIEFQKNKTMKIESEKVSFEKEKQKKITELEKLYSEKCRFGNTKGSEKYNNCLLEQDKKNLVEQKRKEVETKQITEKLAKMSPDDRRAYTCTEKFGFRKGSDKFKDCVFELYKVESELEKLELQKKVAQANLEAAKVKEAAARSEQDRTTALMQRQVIAQEMSAAAALQQARIADFESNQRLFDTGMEMLRGERRVDGSYRAPARAPMNCQYHAKMLSCF